MTDQLGAIYEALRWLLYVVEMLLFAVGLLAGYVLARGR